MRLDVRLYDFAWALGPGRQDEVHLSLPIASDGWDRFPAMAKYPRVRQQSIAVFGESGSGKTVLVSSFYGR